MNQKAGRLSYLVESRPLSSIVLPFEVAKEGNGTYKSSNDSTAERTPSVFSLCLQLPEPRSTISTNDT